MTIERVAFIGIEGRVAARYGSGQGARRRDRHNWIKLAVPEIDLDVVNIAWAKSPWISADPGIPGVAAHALAKWLQRLFASNWRQRSE